MPNLASSFYLPHSTFATSSRSAMPTHVPAFRPPPTHPVFPIVTLSMYRLPLTCPHFSHHACQLRVCTCAHLSRTVPMRQLLLRPLMRYSLRAPPLLAACRIPSDAHVLCVFPAIRSPSSKCAHSFSLYVLSMRWPPSNVLSHKAMAQPVYGCIFLLPALFAHAKVILPLHHHTSFHSPCPVILLRCLLMQLPITISLGQGPHIHHASLVGLYISASMYSTERAGKFLE
jgi:hypothetical protein